MATVRKRAPASSLQSSVRGTVIGPPNTASIASLTLGSGSGGQNMLNVGARQPLDVTGAGGTTVNTTGVLNISDGNTLTTTFAKHLRRQPQCH